MNISQFGDLLGSLAGVAALTEATVQVLKLSAPADRKLTEAQVQWAATGVGVLLAILFVHPVLESTVAVIGAQILAGVLASRGSNYVHDLATVLKSFAEQKKVQAEYTAATLALDK